MASPRPVPCEPLVVKNGSKILSRTSSGMPTPVSLTRSSTRPSALRVSSVSVPPWGIASTAFRMRLVSASRSSAGSPATGGRSGFSRVLTSTTMPRLRGSSCHRAEVASRASSTIRFTLTATKG